MKNALIANAIVSLIWACASVAAAEEPLKPPADTGTAVRVTTPDKPAFQPITLDPTLVKQAMQARAECEDLNRKIIARQVKLYDENPKIKDLQTKMRDIQKQIDKILAEDEELKKLKESFSTIAPEMPVGIKKPGPGSTNLAPISPIPVATNKPPANAEKPVK